LLLKHIGTVLQLATNATPLMNPAFNVTLETIQPIAEFANRFANEPRSTAWHGAAQNGITA
jgi:hypothetical protein